MPSTAPKFSVDIALSLAVPPMLVGLMGAKLMADLMLSVGQASEEIFRGDRLPVLKVPMSDRATTES
jgi:hypothetical protein